MAGDKISNSREIDVRNIILLIILIGLVANAAAAQTKEMKMLNASEFAILPWGGTSGDQSVFDTIRDCGFNLAGFVVVDDLEKGQQSRAAVSGEGCCHTRKRRSSAAQPGRN